MRNKSMLGLFAVLLSLFGFAGGAKQPFAQLSWKDQQGLSKQLTRYVEASRKRDWKTLYDLVSTVGKGGLARANFVRAMKAKHRGGNYSDMPDLRAFEPASSQKDDDGINVYGCGKATREGQIYNGIVVVHAVNEQDTWKFTRWTFTAFPNEPCTRLSNPEWKPYGQMDWSKPMDEVRDLAHPQRIDIAVPGAGAPHEP